MNIFKALTRNVVKWWQFRIMPVFRLDNNRMPGQQIKQQEPEKQDENQQSTAKGVEPVKVGGEDAMAVLNRINREREEAQRREIERARMIAEEKARIAAIMNANKVDVDSFIQAGKEAYEESQEGGSSGGSAQAGNADGSVQIANEDGNVQIGSASASNVQVDDEEEARKQEELRRAQEIIDRLNREAAEDEAKKEAELAAAMQEAAEKFGS